MTASRAAAAVLALALGGCSSPAVPPPPPVLPGATAEVRQFRSDVAGRTVQVTVRARVPLEVRAVRVVADGFGPGPTTPVDVSVPAGGRVDLPTGYGPALCPGPPGGAVALLDLDGGSRLEVPLDDRGLLARLHTAECADRALAQQVRLTAHAGAAAPGRASLPVRLRLERRALGSRVVVHELGSHVVFTVRPAAGSEPPLLVLGPEQASAELALELVPTRCDGHALAENERAGLLGVYVGLDDDPPRLVTVVPDPASRAALTHFAVEGCRSR